MSEENFIKHFPAKLVVSPTINAKMWRLEENFSYITSQDLDSQHIVVEKGFLTDFASVPIPIRFIIPKWGVYGRAAVVHDWLYYVGDSQDRSREYADKVLLEAMENSGVSYPVRILIYKAVDWFGIFAWISNEVKRKRGKTKMDHTGGGAFTYSYSPEWSRDLKTQIPDMWKEWSEKQKLDTPIAS
jgi:hypothetical protein